MAQSGFSFKNLVDEKKKAFEQKKESSDSEEEAKAPQEEQKQPSESNSFHDRAPFAAPREHQQQFDIQR